MATMNFSIPDEVKAAFNEAFKDENKSAVVAELMRRAVEERARGEEEATRLNALIEKVLRERDMEEPVSIDEVRRAREDGRP